MCPAQLPPNAHHFFDTRQLAPQRPGRVIKCKVISGEIAHLTDQKRKCIADGHQYGRAGRWCQAQWTGLSDGPQGDAQVGRLAQWAAGPFGDRHQACPQAPQRGDQSEYFFTLAASRQRDHNIVSANAAQVAVDCVSRMERKRPRAGRCQGRRQLLADEPGFADPRDKHAPRRAMNELRRPRDRVTKLPAHPVEHLGLDPQDFAPNAKPSASVSEASDTSVIMAIVGLPAPIRISIPPALPTGARTIVELRKYVNASCLNSRYLPGLSQPTSFIWSIRGGRNRTFATGVAVLPPPNGSRWQ